jgi:hypothetical protein
MIRAITAVACAGLAACTQYHVKLPAPSPTITPEQRVAMFMAMKPKEVALLQESTDGGKSWTPVSSSLFLANKTEVVSPEDLIPLVGPDSETARAARRSVRARNRKNLWWGVSAVGAISTLVLVGAFTEEPPIDRGLAWSTALIPLVGSVIARDYQRDEIEHRRGAFRHYTRDLGLRLDVCARGTRVVACETPVPAPAPAPAAEPAPAEPAPAEPAPAEPAPAEPAPAEPAPAEPAPAEPAPPALAPSPW